jgi:hypothetical protein
VAHTSKQRDGMRLCGAKKKNGQTCRAFAGQGTTHPGVGRCKFHFGNTKNHSVHAAKVEAQELAAEYIAQFGESHEVDPATALLGVLHLSAGHLNWIRTELANLADKDSLKGQALMRLWDEERDRIARISKMALDVGVAAKQVELAQKYGEQLAALLQAVFYDPTLGLTKAQQSRLPDVLRSHLSAIPTEKPALVA